MNCNNCCFALVFVLSLVIMSTALGQVQLKAQGAGELSSNFSITNSNQTQGGTFEFASASVNVLDNNYSDIGYYENTLSLKGYSGRNFMGLQFTLVNHGKTIMHRFEKAGPCASYDWELTTNTHRGLIQPDGSRIDTIYVLLHATDSTRALVAPISSVDIIKFRYDVVNISTENASTSFSLSQILGVSTDANNANLNTNSNQTVNITNRIQWGDVNGDDQIDIFDLLMVVDHIAGNHLLEGQELTRANIGDWPIDLSAPRQEPPLQINIVDLIILQEVILNGKYPDGTSLAKTAPLAAETGIGISKETVVVDATFMFYIHNSGITIRLVNTVPLKGLQADLVGVTSIPMNIISSLSNSYMRQKDNILRVLAYDLQGMVVGPGDHIIAEIPMNLSNPYAINVQNLLAAGGNNEKLNVVVAYYHSPVDVAPMTEEMRPVNFELGQNYPNPFNPNTNITFTVPRASEVHIMIYNMLGQEVRELFAGRMERGSNTISWDGKDQSGKILASGIYIYRMTAGSFIESKKMMFIK